MSLRGASLFLCYVNLFTQAFDTLYITFTEYKFCLRIYLIWYLSTTWHVISELILLYAVFGLNNHLMPLHMVTNLLGLILQMINHMMLASLPNMNHEMVYYAFYEIFLAIVTNVVNLRYYHLEK